MQSTQKEVHFLVWWTGLFFVFEINFAGRFIDWKETLDQFRKMKMCFYQRASHKNFFDNVKNTNENRDVGHKSYKG